MDDIKKLENEKMGLEKMMTAKEQDYAKSHGGNYMKRDDFKQFAVNLRGKNNHYRQMKKVLGEIKGEVNILNRTEGILKSKASNLEEFNASMERDAGVQGAGMMQE